MSATTYTLTVTVSEPEHKRYTFKIDKQWMEAAQAMVRQTNGTMQLGRAVGAVIHQQILEQFGGVEYNYTLEDVTSQQVIDTGSSKAF